MAKDDTEKKVKKAKRDKKEGKDKSENKGKRSETDGVHKSKKEKKVKRPDPDGVLTTAVLDALEDRGSPMAVTEANGDAVMRVPRPVGALVPFANPLADERVQKKVLKSVKRAAKNRSIKRGVKEVVKSLRKSPTVAAGASPPGIVILAADISPMDVISHIPVLCEDHNIPYLFVTSRAELGAAGSTKRPTSVVMVTPEAGGKKKAPAEGEDGEEDFKEVYKSLLKLVEKESRNVRV